MLAPNFRSAMGICEIVPVGEACAWWRAQSADTCMGVVVCAYCWMGDCVMSRDCFCYVCIIWKCRTIGIIAPPITTARVRTPNRVQSSPIQSSQTHKDAAVILWLTQPRQCLHTSRVESSRVESHESCRVKSFDAACYIFVSQTQVIGRDGCYLEEEMDVEKLILLVKDHEAIYDASLCEHRNRVLHWWWCS